MNVFEQLKAEYEATTRDEWALFPRQGYFPREEEAFLGYEIDGPPQPARGQFVRRADAVFCISAHEKGYPLLMAVFEAAAEMLAAERANTAALAEYRSCVLAQEDLLDGYRDRVNSRERFHSAKLALASALAPLLAEAE
jgi:hypothetical protein